MSALAVIEMVQGMTVVLFVAGAGMAACVAIDAGITHRGAVRVITRMVGRPQLTLYAAAVLVEIRARLAYGQTCSAIHSLSTRTAVAVASGAMAWRGAWSDSVGAHRLSDRTSPTHYRPTTLRSTHHGR